MNFGFSGAAHPGRPLHRRPSVITKSFFSMDVLSSEVNVNNGMIFLGGFNAQVQIIKAVIGLDEPVT